MKTILLKGELRDGLGTSSSTALRNAGKVPCVIYGKSNNINFSVYEADFKNLIYTPNVYKVRLNINGENHEAILQDIQYHPVSESILHVDFMLIDPAKPVVMYVPIRVAGNSPGVRAGGKLVVKITKLHVRGLIQNLPDSIDVDINGLEIGQSVKVKNVVTNGFDILDAQENAVVSCKTTRALMQAADAAAPAKK
jgi:large subunit ribosomal protein L25